MRKVILSRKGFDSGYGRVPSPILPDGRMVSLPIPDRDAPVSYGEIRRDEIVLGDLVADLTRGKIPAKFRAHLDPDLDVHAVPRPSGWCPIFGQSGAALSHLRNQGVCSGDLFLFFGWFRDADRVAGHWRHVGGRPSVHALWGWMQVGEFHDCHALPPDVARWAAGHPHLSGVQPRLNSVIEASGELTVAARLLPGAGTFRSSPVRVLTVPGASRSLWRMPAWMHPDARAATLSYHGERGLWSAVDDEFCQLRSVAKGQEFVLCPRDSLCVDEWLAGLFADVPCI